VRCGELLANGMKRSGEESIWLQESRARSGRGIMGFMRIELIRLDSGHEWHAIESLMS
jgi:hypothetical protein